MYSSTEENNEGIQGPENSINFLYLEGRNYYAQFLELSAMRTSTDEDETELNYQIVTYRSLAIQYLKKSLNTVGDCSEQLLKIDALLLLVQLHSKSGEEKDRESYFYYAVEIARRYLGNDFFDTALGRDIVDMYISVIQPEFCDLFLKIDAQVQSRFVHLLILSESDNRLRKGAEDLTRFCSENHKDERIIEKLEETLGGSIRLSVVSESGEVLIRHGFGNTDPKTDLNSMQSITVDVFDKPRRYSYSIDHGSREKGNQIESRSDVNSVIAYFIAQKEYNFFKYASDNVDTLEIIEKTTEVPQETHDYSDFISRVIAANESSDYITSVKQSIQAFDICCAVTSNLDGDEVVLAQEIDQILEGRINRKVLSITKSILLTRNETMNGCGYPFGLYKKHIPQETRMYAIIRAYEALSRVQNEKKVVTTLLEWAQGGYFDSDVLQIFLESLGAGRITKVPRKRGALIHSVSSYRLRLYKPFIQLCRSAVKTISDIENSYNYGREAGDDTQKRVISFKRANELKIQLLRMIGNRKLFIITRHGETASDEVDGPPGEDDEFLTSKGIQTSFEKGKKFKGLWLKIITSPLIRARHTAEIIRRCTLENIVDALEKKEVVSIEIEEAITNPRKNMENDRYDSLLQKFMSDANVPGIRELLMKMFLSTEEIIYLIVTHRDTARHIIFLLINLFSQDSISGEKTPIENSSIYEFCFQGDRLLDEDEKTKVFLFFHDNWRILTDELNTISMEIFGKKMCVFDENKGVNLIEFNDQTLDYIDLQRENNPIQFDIFLACVARNSITKKLFERLKSVGL